MSIKEQKLVPNARMTSSTSRPININCCLEIVFEKSKHITGIWAKIGLLEKYLYFMLNVVILSFFLHSLKISVKWWNY